MNTAGLNIYNDDTERIEIGIDEAGRGPLFGRVYTAAVVLPKDFSFDHDSMKDSKKFHSEKKILAAADYIKKNALFWSVTWNDETTIDKINIRQAVLTSMHAAIKNIITQLDNNNVLLMVDGNDFKPYLNFDPITNSIKQIDHICLEGGDNKYTNIAAASILAKTHRDAYIKELCTDHPDLSKIYGIDKNKGYGTKQHLEAIREYGSTLWHRKSYGICKTIHENPNLI